MLHRFVSRKAWMPLCLIGLALSGSACSMQNERPEATKSATEAGADPFAGDWGFSTRCSKGHYVGITFKREGDLYMGSWTDGSDLSGSDGKFEGHVRGKKLEYDACSEVAQNGGYEVCPKFTRKVGYFEREGEHLVWYQQYGKVIDRYLTLSRQPRFQAAPLDPAETCAGE